MEGLAGFRPRMIHQEGVNTQFRTLSRAAVKELSGPLRASTTQGRPHSAHFSLGSIFPSAHPYKRGSAEGQELFPGIELFKDKQASGLLAASPGESWGSDPHDQPS